MTKTETKDPRQFPRFSVDIQVSVSLGDRKLAARTRDISRSGLCLISDEEIPRDSEIAVKLVLTFAAGGFSEPLPLEGKVAWCTALFGSYQVGVMFVRVEGERARYLDMFVGLLDGSLAPEDPFGEEEDTDVPLDLDDPFRP
jgi:hypothetical protein